MKTVAIVFGLLLSLPLMAQRQSQDAVEIERNPRAQERIRAARIAYITERLELTPGEAEKFWPIYREYSEKRRALRQEVRDSRKEERDEKEALEMDHRIRQQELDLDKDYSRRLQEVIPAQKVLALRRAERDFTMLLLRQIRKREEHAERLHRQRERTDRGIRPRNNEKP